MCQLANKCEDIVNLQWAEAYCVATRTACCYYFTYAKEVMFSSMLVYLFVT